jgi:hypothetical protein
MLDRLKLVESIKALAKERAKFDKADYGVAPGQCADRKVWFDGFNAMKSDYRLYSKPAAFNRKFVKSGQLETLLNQLSDADIQRAFSGRLSINADSQLEYCTGQYYPTEFQGALKSALESLIASANRLNPELADLTRQMTISDIKDLNARNGGFFFSRDTMRFFQSKLSRKVIAVKTGWLFITSERHREERRGYTIRHCDQAGDVYSISEFQEFSTEKQAIKAAYLEADRIESESAQTNLS